MRENVEFHTFLVDPYYKVLSYLMIPANKNSKDISFIFKRISYAIISTKFKFFQGA